MVTTHLTNIIEYLSMQINVAKTEEAIKNGQDEDNQNRKTQKT